MLVDKPDIQALGARLEDYFTPSTPWTRSLWRLSTLGEGRELLEAWAAHHRAALSEPAVRYLEGGLVRRIKADVGIGSNRDRGILVAHVQRRLLPGSHDEAALREWLDHHSHSYLENWANASEAGELSVETLSRALSSHLLDQEFSRQALNQWLHHHKRRDHVQIYDGPGLIRLARVLEGHSKIDYQVIVPLEAAPPFDEQQGSGSCWLTATQTSRWLADRFPGISLRQSGSLRLTIQARDVRSALTVATSEMIRMRSRFRVGARTDLEFHSHA